MNGFAGGFVRVRQRADWNWLGNSQVRHPLCAIVLVVAAASLAPVGDLFAKLLSASYAAVVICFGRYLAGGAIGLGLLLCAGRFHPPPLRKIPGHAFRALLAASSILCLIAALKHAPLADVMAGFYLAPVFSTVLSAVLLGERLSATKTAGTGLALLGAVAILDPSGAVSMGGGLAVLSGALFALYLITARGAGGGEDGASAAVVQSLIAAALVAPLVFSDPPAALSWTAIGLFALIGLISILCQGATLVAHRWADASTLAPFFYAALISSLGLGAFVLGETPTITSLLGILAIATGGVMVAMNGLRRPEAGVSPPVTQLT